MTERTASDLERLSTILDLDDATKVISRVGPAPAVRTQNDGRGDEYSRLTGHNFPRQHDTARQEFKADADVNLLLKKFGVGQVRGPGEYRTIDYGVDLQTALAAVDAAKRAHATLPADVRGQYPTWQSMLAAAESGELTLSTKEDTAPIATPATTEASAPVTPT